MISLHQSLKGRLFGVKVNPKPRKEASSQRWPEFQKEPLITRVGAREEFASPVPSAPWWALLGASTLESVVGLLQGFL